MFEDSLLPETPPKRPITPVRRAYAAVFLAFACLLFFDLVSTLPGRLSPSGCCAVSSCDIRSPHPRDKLLVVNLVSHEISAGQAFRIRQPGAATRS